MAQSFDLCHQWPGKPLDEQPPHHSRLLALNLFASDADAAV